jgi:hypothetical protein
MIVFARPTERRIGYQRPAYRLPMSTDALASFLDNQRFLSWESSKPGRLSLPLAPLMPRSRYTSTPRNRSARQPLGGRCLCAPCGPRGGAVSVRGAGREVGRWSGSPRRCEGGREDEAGLGWLRSRILKKEWPRPGVSSCGCCGCPVCDGLSKALTGCRLSANESP